MPCEQASTYTIIIFRHEAVGVRGLHEESMMRIGQRTLVAIATLLDVNEREAVLGDLAEAGEAAWTGITAIASLVIRKQFAIQENRQLWVAAMGLALPGTLFLMGFSLAMSRPMQRLVDPRLSLLTGLTIRPGLSVLICRVLLLICWAWAGRFLIGTIARRAIWISVALSGAGCLVCFSKFPEQSLATVCLLLFLFPAAWGLRQGLRLARINLRSAIVLFPTVLLLSVATWNRGGAWILTWTISWPAWYFATATRPTS